MKSYVIISHEYEANLPSVFLKVESLYYGCQIYPKARKNPLNIDYWRTATSSDADRGFTVREVALHWENLEKITRLQRCIDANAAMITKTSWPTIPKNWTVKRGKVYEAYKAETAALSAKIKDEEAYNAPYERAMHTAFRELRKILLDLPIVENPGH